MSGVRFGSVCSGIEAASVAWHPLGWEAAWLAEIEPFPCAVLAHHYPDVPNLGDMTGIVRRVLSGEVEAPDVFTGGTPCQAFSVAGKRESLADARGNLSLTFCEIADAIDHVRTGRGDEPAVIVWENVPGVLSTADNAFGCFLGALAGSGCELQPTSERKGRWSNAGCVYGPRRAVAWRVLDAQYFGLAQRRRRVFVVASARAGFDPAAVLLEPDGVRRDSAPRREAGAGASVGTLGGTSPGGGWRFGADEAAVGQLIPQWPAEVACTLNASFGDKQGLENQHLNGGGRCSSLPSAAACLTTGTGKWYDPETETLIPTIGGGFDVAHSLRGEGFDASEDGTGRGTPLVPVAFDTTQITSAANRSNPQPGGPCHPLAAGAHPPAIAFSCKDRGADAGELAPTLRAMGHGASHPNAGGQVAVAQQGTSVRRLTPRECERLQGFPDDHTLIPWRGKPAEQCPDGPRYKALGNSWAVPCARWIGKRIQRAIV